MATLQTSSLAITPVDEIIIDELPTLAGKARAEQIRTIREWGLMLGCSKRRSDQLAYFYSNGLV